MKKLENIKIIGNIGTGTMGYATAMLFAMHGYRVKLFGRSDESFARAFGKIRSGLETYAEAGIIPVDHIEEIIANIEKVTTYAELADVDFVIESIVEDVAVKQAVWSDIEKAVSEDAILATNTSGLSPTEIQSVLAHPERFVVAHFWNPAHLMPLVEVVPGARTNPETVQTTVELMKRLGKKAVALKKESLGFVGNRIQDAVLRECYHIIEEGIADPEAIDEIVLASVGLRWSILGPVTSADLGGLDIFYNSSIYLYSDLANYDGPDPVLEKKIRSGDLGLKTGKGFYDWSGGKGAETVRMRDKKMLEFLRKG